MTKTESEEQEHRVSFFKRLLDARVIQSLAIYIPIGWILSEIVAAATENFGFPYWVEGAAIALFIAGIPVIGILAWAFQITENGIRRDVSGPQAGLAIAFAVSSMFVVGLILFQNIQSGQTARKVEHPVADSIVDVAEKSIAVLPFINMSSDEGNDYLGDGITEEIRSSLANIPGLRVPARTSSLAFKDKADDIKQIGKLLGVATILEGSVRRSGNLLRITAQLVSVADGYQLWSQKYDREMTNIFEIQDNIAHNIVDKLKITLDGSPSQLAAMRSTDNVDAYALFLKGRFFADKYTESDLHRSIAYFEEALSHQPDYARAYAGLTYAYGSLRFFGYTSPSEITINYRAAAEKTLELDENLPEAHSGLALLHYNADWDWLRSEQEFKKALQLDPANVWARGLYAFLLATMQRFPEAMVHAAKIEEIDPLSATAITQPGWISFFAGDYETALNAGLRAVAFEPNFANAHELMGYAYFKNGDHAEAILTLEKATSLNYSPIVLGNLGWMYGRVGRIEDAKRTLKELTERSAAGYVPSSAIASIHSGLGEYAEANRWMEKAIEDREGILVLLGISIIAGDVERNPYFQGWLKKIGLAALQVP